MLGEDYEPEGALAQRTQRLVLLDAVLRVEALRFEDLVVPVLLLRRRREVDGALLRRRADQQKAVLGFLFCCCNQIVICGGRFGFVTLVSTSH